MMSKKCKYALKALVHLGRRYGEGSVATSEIAAAERIPKKFLEQILLELKKAGYVQSRQGTLGGYFMVKKPSEIPLSEVYRIFDGAIAMLPCISEKFYERCADCPDEAACGLNRAFAQIREETYEVMARHSVESLL